MAALGFGSRRLLFAATNSAARSLHSSSTQHALTKFTMPAMSPTMTEGGVSAWKKKAGEKYTAGDVLLEVETDKATMDIEAQDDGVMIKILVEDGAKGVPVGKVIAITGEEGDPTDGAEVDKLVSDSAKETPSEDKQEEPVKPKESDKPQEKADNKTDGPTDKQSSSKPSSTAESSETKDTGSAPRDFIYASPIAKRLAQDRGIPLKDIKGSGPNGRIVKEDVEKFKQSSQSGSSSGGAQTSSSAPLPSADVPYEDIPLSAMRKVIAQRLSESKQSVPHYYVTTEFKMDRLLKMREVFNDAAKRASDKDGNGIKLSVNDFVVKAVGLALRDVPEVNAAWMGNGILRQYKKADISIAVATPTGLITPIITDAGARGLASISSRTKELAKKARDGKLKPDEYQGGTFTISNLGMFGSVDEFAAIVNPPQAAILAVGGTEQKLAIDAESEKGFKAIQVMKMTLSADHRVIDGAVGARFMKALKDLIENPLSFML